MLLLMMELKGRFNSKMIKRAKFGDVYFDDMGGFDSVEKDRVTGSVSNSRALFSIYLMTFASGCCPQSPHLEANTRYAYAVNATSVCEAKRWREQALVELCRSARQVFVAGSGSSYHSPRGSCAPVYPWISLRSLWIFLFHSYGSCVYVLRTLYLFNLPPLLL